jgi:hypothetical protein
MSAEGKSVEWLCCNRLASEGSSFLRVVKAAVSIFSEDSLNLPGSKEPY